MARKSRWLWLLGISAVLLGVFLNWHGKHDAPPPGNVTKVDGTKTPVIGPVPLTQLLRQHQFSITDLTFLNSGEAVRDIRPALEAVYYRPGDVAAFGQLGRVFQSHQYPEQALACYSQAAALDPDAYEWAYYIGRIHAEVFEFGAAIEAYERAAELNPEYAPTFLALGNLYLQSGEASKARKAYQRFVTLRPQSSHGYLGLAQIAFDDQDYKVAVELLSEAISRNQQDFRAHNLLGQAYHQLGQAEQARYHLGIVKSFDRRDQLTKHVSFDDPLYHQMLASNTTSAALTARMRAAIGTGQSAVAIRLGEQLCQRHPKDADRMNSLAMAYKQAKRYAEALDHAEKAIQLDSDYLDAYATKAQLLMILRRNEEALELLDWIVAQDPDSFRSQYYHGAAQALAGQYEAAIESFRHAIRINDGSARAHVGLAEALGQTGRKAEAIDAYRRALELDPVNVRAVQRLRELQK